MNGLLLSALILFPIAAFLTGAYIGSKNGMLYRVNMFRDLDYMIGSVEHITSITNDRRIAPSVVIDQLNELKYSLNLPIWVERQYEEHPPA